MSRNYITDCSQPSVPIRVVSDLESLKGSGFLGAWITTNQFKGEPGEICLVPNSDGALGQVLAGHQPGQFWHLAKLAEDLPGGHYSFDDSLPPEEAFYCSLAWGLAGYRFDRYKTLSKREAILVLPKGVDETSLTSMIETISFVRDLINTPSSDMGPAELAQAAIDLAGEHDASINIIEGEELVKQNYPAVYTVGKGSVRAPRVIDLTWGDPKHPKLSLVGKGVCFDSGGLNIKPPSGMKFMKKDMGGAAHVLGLAKLIMGAKLPIRLRVLIAAVENSVSGNAMRPLDVTQTRKGLTIEIGHTDAEGRVILSDVLAEADSESPQLIIDYATLTGAARVALGTQLPALFSNHQESASKLLEHGIKVHDPLWQMPLWAPYKKFIKSNVADLNNDSSSAYGGSITAALFLEHFISPTTPWMHIDMMAWNEKSEPGRPEGGEAMALRALYSFIEERFCKS